MSLQLPLLHPELIAIIVGLVIHAYIRNVGNSSLASRLFKESCDSHCRSCQGCGTLRLFMSNLQPFHVRLALDNDIGLGDTCTISVRWFMNAVGRSSGFGIALKSMLHNHGKWSSDRIMKSGHLTGSQSPPQKVRRWLRHCKTLVRTSCDFRGYTILAWLHLKRDFHSHPGTSQMWLISTSWRRSLRYLLLTVLHVRFKFLPSLAFAF